VLLTGCGAGDELDTVYGLRSGVYGGKSINGTAVLSEMFEEAGHSISSRRYLSPKLAEADVIIWCPEDFAPPSEDTRKWLDRWLNRGGRTMIYVGRDYDAEPDYWPEVIPQMPAAQQAEGQRRAGNAKQSFDLHRKDVPEEADAEWYSVDGKAKPRDVTAVKGPWAAGMDATKAKIKLNSRIKLAKLAEPLLETDDGDLIVSRETRTPDYDSVDYDDEEYQNDDVLFASDDSQIIIVANGSFLLNYPLVNHEHRKLAGKLIGEVPADASVVFLEGPNPQEREKEPEAELPTGVEMFSIWPMNWILVHLGVVGVFFLLARWPIFGLPRSLKGEAQADFGKHVAALAELLARTRDRGFAIARLQQYRQLTKKESAEKPVPAKPPEPPPAAESVTTDQQ